MFAQLIFMMAALFGPMMVSTEDKILVCFIGMIAMIRVMYNNIMRGDYN